MPGIPFQSKLEPFYDFIRECRMKRWSYARIALAITQDHGMKVSSNTVFSFVKVRAKKRKLYTLPPQPGFGFNSPDEVTARPAGEELNRMATSFFTSPGEPLKPASNRTKNEKRPYRLDF